LHTLLRHIERRGWEGVHVADLVFAKVAMEPVMPPPTAVPCVPKVDKGDPFGDSEPTQP
jgi:hypothetical protein